MAGEEKTEKATPKKRKDTRKKGEVLQSKEVAVAVFVVGIFAFLAIFGNYMFQMLLNFMEQSMSSIDKTGNTVEFAMSVFRKVAIICVCTVGPILAVGVVLSVLPVIVQTKGLFSMEAMKPKFSRLNPFTGIKRLFSMQALVGLVKGLIEIIVVVAILYFQVMDRISEFKKLIDTDVIKAFSGDTLVMSKTMGDWRTHNGTDYAGNIGDPVRAVNNGRVTRVYDDVLWGTTVEIDHLDGLTVRYCGLGKGSTVSEGDEVKINDKIGNLSEIPAESADGTHFHIEAEKDGKYIDFESLLTA